MEMSFVRFNCTKSVLMCQNTKCDIVVIEIILLDEDSTKKKRRKNGKVAFAGEIMFVRKNLFAQNGIFEKKYSFV